MQAIYEPKGKALEYSPLALNLYRGCDHACTYCYAPLATRRKVADFVNSSPRPGILNAVIRDAEELKRVHNTKPILLCFTCDPYQQIDVRYQLTRETIKILHVNEQHVTILTKGGKRSERDFHLLAEHPDMSTYATTLTFTDEFTREKYEPGAAPTAERIAALKKAHDLGIETWISCEPVIRPSQTLELIEKTAAFVDLVKVGKANYIAESKAIDWKDFAHSAVDLLEKLGKKYYIKDDLRKFL